MRIDKRYALVDTGFKKLARFDRRSLRPSQLLKEAEGGEPRKPGEFRAGDQLEFKVTDIESAFGDMQISSNILPDGDRFEMLWEELEQIQAARKQVRRVSGLIYRTQLLFICTTVRCDKVV